MHRWLKQGLVAVIAVAAVFGGMVAAQAAGIDVFCTIGRWTDEVFHFVPSADENNQATGAYAGENAPEYSDLREALASLEIDESLAPTWFPNGFEAGNLEVVSSSVSDIVNFVASSEMAPLLAWTLSDTLLLIIYLVHSLKKTPRISNNILTINRLFIYYPMSIP